MKQALWDIVRDDKSLQMMHDLTAQFENFILKPALQLHTTGPIVIIIDALDESGDPRSRRTLISLLAKRMSELPANFRILLTTCLLNDIEGFFCKNSLIMLKCMDDVANTKRDILAYMSAQLCDLDGRHLEFFDNARC